MDSMFLKAALAVDSDPWFLMRLKVACEMAGVEYTHNLGVAVASACTEWISVTDEMTVDTTQVTDEQISLAVAAYDPEAETPDSELLLTLARVDATLMGFTMELLDSSGREPGAEWVQPKGAHDAYPEGWITIHGDRSWVSLVPFNTTEPGSDIRYWRVEGEEVPDEIVPWREQQWPEGSRVSSDGHVWLAIQDVLVPNWKPSPALWEYWKDEGEL